MYALYSWVCLVAAAAAAVSFSCCRISFSSFLYRGLSVIEAIDPLQVRGIYIANYYDNEMGGVTAGKKEGEKLKMG